MAGTDRIEKQVLLHAPRTRVWRALSDAAEFGKWFGIILDGTFKVGRPLKGTLTNKGYEHVTFDIVPEKIEPETTFSYRWHPFAIDPKTDYSGEPMTLVEFRLEDADGGTRLTVTESGFDRIPAARRDEAFRMNDRGWSGQLKNIQRHVEG